MDKQDKSIVEKLEQLETLSSIWIMASNDENPLMFYDSIRERLDLDVHYPLKELISKRSELFRRIFPDHRLKPLKKQWIEELETEKPKIPSFLFKIDDKQKRIEKINSISENDIFRSQFRIEANAPKSPIETINWGLQHIEGIRLNIIEKDDQRNKNIKEFWLPIIPLVITSIALILSVILQLKSQKTQVELKKYEISFKPKQEYYSTTLNTMNSAFNAAINNDSIDLVTRLSDIEKTYYNIEPFLNTDQRKQFYDEIKLFSAMCLRFAQDGSIKVYSKPQNVDSLKAHQNYMRDNLYPILFKDEATLLK